PFVGVFNGRLSHGCDQTFPSSLDVGLGPISAGREFFMPTPVLVFVGDGRRLAGDDLFPRGALCSFAGQVVTRKWLGEYPIDAIGPAPIRFDDLIGKLGHVWLPALNGPTPVVFGSTALVRKISLRRASLASALCPSKTISIRQPKQPQGVGAADLDSNRLMAATSNHLAASTQLSNA